MSIAELLWFDVDGVPKGEGRPRVNKHTFAIHPDPTADEWKHLVRARAVTVLRDELAGGVGLARLGTPMAVEIVFRMPRPKNHWRTGRFAGMLKPNAPHWHTSKPDDDNLVKATVDAISTWDGQLPIFWADDSQVARKNGDKRYVLPGEKPGALICIYRLVDPPRAEP